MRRDRAPGTGSETFPGGRAPTSPDTRAVSEALGFVFVFAIVVTAVTLVSVAGYAQLQDVRSVERTNGAERAFETLADDVEEVAHGGAPSRATEVGLSEGQLYAGEAVTIRVSGERAGDPAENFTHEVRTRPVVHETRSGGRVVYVSGAVVREEEGGASVMVREPDLVLTGQRTVLPVVRTAPERERRVGGTNTVLVRTTRGKGTVHEVTEAPYRVTVEVTTPRAKAWLAFLDGSPATTCSRSGETVTCSLTTDRVYLSTIRVSVGFD